MMNSTMTRKGGMAMAYRCRNVILAAAAVVALGACDTDVENPGPVPDSFLDRQTAQQSLVNGMGRAVAEGLNWLSYTTAAVTREIHPAGSTGSFGINIFWQRGEFDENDDALNTHWNQAQQARWLAEDGVRRIEEAGASSDSLLTRAYLYAGYANRLLGETMCQAVIDGGAAQAYTVFLERAESYFGKAIDKGTGNQRLAAYAGRASVRADLGKWTEAVADASQVTSDAFAYNIAYYDVGSDAQRNRIFWAAGTQPYKAHTQWNTVYEAYFAATNDPRVRWQTTTTTGDAAIECCGRVPFYPQQKYTSSASPIRLSGGGEMRLIEAEALLRNNDVAGAMAKINQLRTAAGVPTRTAANINEAWTFLKREKGIVLWLEGRRMADLRRWKAANTPGDLDPLELPSGSVETGSHLVRQDLCIPIPLSERQTNPNIS
jgi:hypothetical protein